jgi:hypothetical protein
MSQHLTLPDRLYSLKYDDTYFGFKNPHREFGSMVFAFPKKTHVNRVKSLIAKRGTFPKILRNDDSQYYFKKHTFIPKNELIKPLRQKHLSIMENSSEELIINLGFNQVDTCIIFDIEEDSSSVLFTSYYHIAMSETYIDNIVENLENIYSVEKNVKE